jgi:hypothetical protein
MKRIVKIASAFIVLLLLPALAMTGQVKEKEKHVKIVVSDKDGTTVEIDTLIKGDILTDSIKLKNGEVIYLASHGKSVKTMHMEGDTRSMVVTVSSDDKGDTKQHKKVIVVSCDSAHADQGEDIIIIKGGKQIKDVKGGNVISISSSDSDSKEEKYVYITEDKNKGKKGEKTVEVRVTTDDKNNTIERTKYVIAKDGMVVTVEGNDDAKAKELIKEIESKLGVNKDEKGAKEEVKETKKSSKK